MAVRTGLIALALACVASGGGTATPYDPVGALAGRYHEEDSHADVIAVDARHAYAHIYVVGGDSRICEFEQVMDAAMGQLSYRGRDEDGSLCALSLRRRGARLAWSEPAQSTCRRWCGVNDYLNNGGLPWKSRRAIGRSRELIGEGTVGYAETVMAWRAARRP